MEIKRLIWQCEYCDDVVISFTTDTQWILVIVVKDISLKTYDKKEEKWK